jgi:hypothetical protein
MENRKMFEAKVMGNIYRIEEKTSAGGKEYTNATLRDSVKVGDKFETRFFNLVFFGAGNLKFAKELVDGTAVIVKGEASVKNGKETPTISIVVNSIRRCMKDVTPKETPKEEVEQTVTAKASPFG